MKIGREELIAELYGFVRGALFALAAPTNGKL